MNNLKNIHKFYWIFAFVLLLLAVLIIFVVRTMFSSLTIANQIDEEIFEKSIPRLNNVLLDEAYGKTKEQNIPSLDLRQ